MYEQIARNKRRSVLYVIVFVVAWLAVGAAIGWLVSAVETGVHGPRDIAVGLIVAAAVAGVAVAFTFRSGTRFVLSVAHARPADPVADAILIDLVAALALGDGLPAPAVYIVDDVSPNAFATGISPQHAAVTVTSGLLAVMNREELEGVLGHEISHIKNYDTRLLLIVTTLIGMAGLLASVIWRSAFVVRGRGRNAGQLTLVLLAAGLLLALVGFVIGPLIRLALSRRRESLADASGVALTRNPIGLLNALKRLQADEVPMTTMNHATAAMCIADPLRHHGGLHHLFDTHPPLQDRIAALERTAQGLAV